MSEVQQIRLLLSGGIGAGKSAVGGLLAARGIPVIHTDLIGHSVLEPEGEAFATVSSGWPRAVVDGRIDRSRLAEIVFADSDALLELEALTHPAIARQVFAKLEQFMDDPLVVVEIPHLNDLLGDGWSRVVVVATAQIRLDRLEDRGMDPTDAKARMAAQPSDEQWANAADFIIDNNAGLDELEAEVDRLLEGLLG